jgi:pheromone shutdown-related protein TraB|tara:strand:- start:126 stop:785 length:660 start_codon:yes stop_codon:yes gene_type:complete
MNEVKLIGTSHISKESVNEVKKVFEKFNPDIMALELDPMRFHALIAKKRKRNIYQEMKYFGIRGLILNSLGSWIENKIGKKVGMKPGSEMKTAIKLAKENKKEIALIDQDIRITIKKLTKISFKEKFKLFFDLLRSPFAKNELKKIDFSKVPEQDFIDKLIKELKKRYPEIFKILIDDRNKILAKNLNNLKKNQNNKKILAIVGAGHKKEIKKLIENEN